MKQNITSLTKISPPHSPTKIDHGPVVHVQQQEPEAMDVDNEDGYSNNRMAVANRAVVEKMEGASTADTAVVAEDTMQGEKNTPKTATMDDDITSGNNDKEDDDSEAHSCSKKQNSLLTNAKGTAPKDATATTSTIPISHPPSSSLDCDTAADGRCDDTKRMKANIITPSSTRTSSSSCSPTANIGSDSFIPMNNLIASESSLAAPVSTYQAPYVIGTKGRRCRSLIQSDNTAGIFGQLSDANVVIIKKKKDKEAPAMKRSSKRDSLLAVSQAKMTKPAPSSSSLYSAAAVGRLRGIKRMKANIIASSSTEASSSFCVSPPPTATGSDSVSLMSNSIASESSVAAPVSPYRAPYVIGKKGRRCRSLVKSNDAAGMFGQLSDANTVTIQKNKDQEASSLNYILCSCFGM